MSLIPSLLTASLISSESADNDKIDKLLALIQSTIGKLNDHFSSVYSKLDSSSRECHERINLLESKFDSDMTALNDQIDGAFGYVDIRMDLIFTAKSDAINSQFIEVAEATDFRIDNHVSELSIKLMTDLR